MAKREPFPLQWPEGWKRTHPHNRQRSKFGFRNSGQVPFAKARMDLLAELERLGAANVVITSDLPTRLDGLPYANGRADDPGIAVWFALRNGSRWEERVFACDKWLSPAENMQAIALSVEAMRGLARWGAGDVVTRAFSGFAALPAGGETGAPQQPATVIRSWREVFEVEQLVDVVAPRDLIAIVKSRHRDKIKQHHPDLGGDPQIAIELNAALAEAERELGA